MHFFCSHCTNRVEAVTNGAVPVQYKWDIPLFN